MKKYVASLLLALAMLGGVIAADTTPASAGDICENCVEIVPPVDCGDPNAHNWKVCGDDGDGAAPQLLVTESVGFGGKDSDGSGKGDPDKHNRKDDF